MRKLLCAVLMLISVLNAGAQNMKSEIDSLLKIGAMGRSSTGVVIYDLNTNEILYSHDADKLFRPASILKLLTGITAADKIGGDNECFHTAIYYTGNLTDGVLNGDIYVKGDFDPEFMDKDMNSLVHYVVSSGVKSIKGRVIGDESMADSLYWGEGWCWDDTPSAFQPYMSPLMYEKGRVQVSVAPLGKGGAVNVFPVSSYYKVKDLRRVPPYNRMSANATRNWVSNGNDIIITGSANKAYSCELNMYRSQDFFMQTFVDRLNKAGIKVSGYKYGEVPSSAVEKFAVTRKLDEAMHEMFKESDNLSADAILFQLGQKYHVKQLNRDDCVKVVKTKIKELGLNPANYRIVDGCGVSLYNYVSPALMLEFLKFAYNNESVRNDVYPNLPVCTKDGTLRHRMYGTEAAGRVHAKTGTVSGVSSLAGYVESKCGHTIAFVIISNGIMPIRKGHEFQDKVCEMLVRYNPGRSAER